MSAYREQETAMTDVDCLKDSLQEMPLNSGQKCTPEVHAQPVHLEGYHGDKRRQTAEIVIKRSQVGSSSNDIGFARSEDGNFKAIISSFDSGFYNEKWMKELKKKYAEKKVMKSASNAGLFFKGRTVTEAGRTQLQFVKH